MPEDYLLLTNRLGIFYWQTHSPDVFHTCLLSVSSSRVAGTLWPINMSWCNYTVFEVCFCGPECTVVCARLDVTVFIWIHSLLIIGIWLALFWLNSSSSQCLLCLNVWPTFLSCCSAALDTRAESLPHPLPCYSCSSVWLQYISSLLINIGVENSTEHLKWWLCQKNVLYCKVLNTWAKSQF